MFSIKDTVGTALGSLGDIVFKPNPKFSRSKYIGWNPRKGQTYFPNAKHEREKARNLRSNQYPCNNVSVTPRPEVQAHASRFDSKRVGKRPHFAHRSKVGVIA